MEKMKSSQKVTKGDRNTTVEIKRNESKFHVHLLIKIPEERTMSLGMTYWYPIH